MARLEKMMPCVVRQLSPLVYVTLFILFTCVAFTQGASDASSSTYFITARASTDLRVAYDHLTSLPITATHIATFGGDEVIGPGVYSIAGAGSVCGTLTLRGTGDKNDDLFVFVFSGALTTCAVMSIELTNGSTPSGVFWITTTGAAIAIAGATPFVGTCIASAAISAGSGAYVDGRLLSLAGAVAVDSIHIVAPVTEVPSVSLGAASSFALFTCAGAVGNTASSTYVSGDVGTNDGGISGFESAIVNGHVYTSTDQVASCTSVSGAQCLDRLSDCSVDYAALPTPVCVRGPPTDGCSDCVSSTACYASGCIWDPFISHCFVTAYQAAMLFACSAWSSNTSSLSCAFHNCEYDSSGVGCVDAVNQSANVTINTASVVSMRTVARWFGETTPPGADAASFQTYVSVPLFVDLEHPVWYVVGLGTPSATTGVGQTYSAASICTTQVTDARVDAPSAIQYTAGSIAQLTAHLLAWIRANHNLDFDTTSPEGVALRKYYGNMTIGLGSVVRAVSVSSDATRLVFTVRPLSLAWMYENCMAYGVTYNRSIDSYVDSYTFAFTLAARSSSDEWSAVSAAYSVGIQTNGAVVIASTAQSFHLTALVRETVATRAVCPTGQQSLSIILDLSYAGVWDAGAFVGPRSVQDVTIGVASCYHDEVIALRSLGCSGGVCTTRVNMLSQCMNMPMTGRGFVDCANSPAAIRITDMGADVPYPPAYDTIHPLVVDAYWSIGGSHTVTANHELNIGVDILAYPTSFVTSPPIGVDFGMLAYATQTLDQALATGDANSFSGAFNVSNDPYDSHTLDALLPDMFSASMNSVSLAVQLTNTALRAAYTLTLVLADVLIVPTDARGVARADLVPASWRHVQAMTIDAPRDFRETTCPSCPTITTCLLTNGCDGFTVWSGALTQLFPDASGFMFFLPYTLAINVASVGSTQMTTSEYSTKIAVYSSNTEEVSSKTITATASSHVSATSSVTSDVSLDGQVAQSSSALFLRADWLTGATGPQTCVGVWHCWSPLARTGAVAVPILSCAVLLFLVLWWRSKRSLRLFTEQSVASAKNTATAVAKSAKSAMSRARDIGRHTHNTSPRQNHV